MCVDLETHNPDLSYFEVMEMEKFDQSVPRMLAAIKGCFTKNNMSKLWDKLTYISAAAASMTSGKDFGLIAQIQADHGRVLFVWYCSHRLDWH